MRYTHPHQFEPLLPQKRLEELQDIAQRLNEAAIGLRGALTASTAAALTGLLRKVSAYYSNRIDGAHVSPADIEKAVHEGIPTDLFTASEQQNALSHIRAEEKISSWSKEGFSPFSTEGICRIHEALYSSSDPWRKADARVGRNHTPPIFNSIQLFLARYEEFYSEPAAHAEFLVKIACAHQRLLWIHPFAQGNGRVARLASQAALCRDFSGDLWSLSRAIAKTERDYYSFLELADEPRKGDLYGKGNLSEEGLWQFCHYFLSICLDQVNFMRKAVDFDAMRLRIRALLSFRGESDRQMRREAELPLHYLYTSGQLTRAEFKQMTGLGDKVAQNLLSKLLKEGFVESDTPLGPVRFAMPLSALSFYFPDLWPESA